MSLSRTGCCDTWPKPCPYHEGVADALDAVGLTNMRVRAAWRFMLTIIEKAERADETHLSVGADPCPCPDFEAES